MSDEPHRHHKVHTFLRQHTMGVLSTVSQDGKPWGAAIYYVADENFNFYFVTRTETAKYQNLDSNPHAALTVADPATRTTVQAAGAISRVPVEDYMDIVFHKLADIRPKNDPHWSPPLDKLQEGDYMPLRLTPTKLHYADYSQVKSDPHADYIERIIGT